MPAPGAASGISFGLSSAAGRGGRGMGMAIGMGAGRGGGLVKRGGLALGGRTGGRGALLAGFGVDSDEEGDG